MAEYDQLKSVLQNNIYQNASNAVTGAILQSTLMSFINTIGTGSGYMGLLSNNNKPRETVDGKQFYLGINEGGVTVTVDCTAVGLGNIAITQRTLWIVWSDGTGWHKQDLASGISTVIPSNVNDLSGYNTLQLKETLTELSGDVTITELQSNMAYILYACTSLSIATYAYDHEEIKKCITLPETHIVVYVVGDIDVSLPAVSSVRVGDSPALEDGGTYLITVKGTFWKIEKYA